MDSSEILARLEVVEDRQQIYDVLTRYCRALDRCDLALMKSVYWEDGYDNHGVFQGNAQDYAAFIIPEIQQWFEMTMHAICNVHIELDGHRAHVESYLISYCQVKADRGRIEGVFGPSYLREVVGEGEPLPQDFLYGGRYWAGTSTPGGLRSEWLALSAVISASKSARLSKER